MIEQIVLKYNKRGMDKINEQIPPGYYDEAAKAILSLEKGRHVLLFTGFWVGGAAETDGPVGAYFLAKALRAMGYYPLVVTDMYANQYFSHQEENFETLIVPIRGFSEEFMYNKILETYDAAALIAIERCGMDEYGLYSNKTGENIGPNTAPLDWFFLEGEELLTIGIGDGGNEIGMGKHAALLKEYLGHECPCAISTKHNLLATTSNWGSFGLIAALDKTLVPSIKEVSTYYDHILDLGAKDGISKKSEKSVDGFGIDKTEEILGLLARS